MTSRFARLAAILATITMGVAHAATYTLPAGAKSGPFSSCTGTAPTFSCSGDITFGGVDTINLTAAVTLNVGGNFTADKSLTITSNGHAFVINVGGNFTIKNNASINSATVVAGGNIDLKNTPTLVGNFTAGGNITMANNATVTGNLTAGGNITTGTGANITGNVNAGGQLTVGSGTITGSCSYASTNYICSATGPNHYELSLPTSGIACLATPVTVTACANSSSPCTSAYAAASGKTATLAASGGTLGATTVTFNASGVATTTLAYPAATEGAVVAVTLSGEQTAASSPRKCCPDGANCFAANNCSTIFSTAGFIFSTAANGSVATIGNQIAGTRSATDYYLRAVKSSTTTKACEAALTGSTAVNLGYSCSNPTSCTSGNYMNLTPYDGTTEKTTVGVPAGGGSVTLYFDANGNAPLKFNYLDVGSIAFSASKVAGGALLSSLSGTSNNFVVRPYALVLSGIKCTTASADYCGAGALALGPPKTPGDNPGATTAAGSPTFIRAGHPFSVTVTAQAEGGSATPNFGKETVPEWVKLTPALHTGLGLTANPSIDRTTTGGINAGSSTLTVADSVGYATADRIRVAGAGAAGADLVTTVAAVPSATSITLSAPAATTVAGAEVNYMFPAFSGGSATGSNFTWDEVGILTLTPAIGDGNYLGAGSVTGTASDPVGRFYPHHFSVDAALVTRSDLLSKFASTTGAIDAGTSALTVASATGINIGHALRIAGAGSAGAPLGAIVANVAGNVLTLSIAASSTVSGTAVHNLTDVSGTAAAFTYMNEPLLARTTATARSANEKTTANYASANSFAKLDAASLTSPTWLATGTTSCPVNTQCFGFGAIDGAGPTALTGRLSVDSRVSSPASYWSGGIGYFATHLQLARPTTTASDATWGSYNALSLGVAPWDTDGVTLPNASSSDTAHRVNFDADNSGTNERWKINTAATSIRFGRLRLINFYGSELLPARVEYRAEYWDGNRWAINALDSTTALVAGNIATGGLTVGTVGALANGVGFITFATAGVGSHDIALNLNASGVDTSCNATHPATTATNLPWLQGYWSGSCGGTAAWQQDPSARIRLGSPKAPYIYLRERY